MAIPSTAKHWPDRAAEMRALPDGYSDNEAAEIMLRLANDYDRFADRAEAGAAHANREKRVFSSLDIGATARDASSH